VVQTEAYHNLIGYLIVVGKAQFVGPSGDDVDQEGHGATKLD